MDGWTYGHADVWTYGRLDVWTVGRLDGRHNVPRSDRCPFRICFCSAHASAGKTEESRTGLQYSSRAKTLLSADLSCTLGGFASRPDFPSRSANGSPQRMYVRVTVAVTVTVIVIVIVIVIVARWGSPSDFGGNRTRATRAPRVQSQLPIVPFFGAVSQYDSENPRFPAPGAFHSRAKAETATAESGR